MHSRCREKGRGISYRGKDLDIFLCTPCNCISIQRHTLCVCNTTLCNSSPSVVPAGLLLLLSTLLLAANF